MKTKIIITGIILLFTTECRAQLIHSYGLKLGIVDASQSWTYSGILTGATAFEKSRIGLDLGGYIEWLDLPVVSLLTEAHYIQKGAIDEFPLASGQIRKSTLRIDYLSFPVLAKFRFGTPLITAYGAVGPRIDFYLGKNKDATAGVFDGIKSSDFGATVGLGFEIPIIIGYKLGSEFRYSYSSTDIIADQYLVVKNSSAEFLVTIGF